MAVTTRDLARVTVDTPQRRLDVAVPSNVPVADLLLAFVRAGGERLGATAASGWVVRRTDGTLLSTAETLQDQGVRDGAVLHLVPAETTWPELEYDDIADAIAATRTRDRVWTPAATRWAGAVSGTIGLLVALAAIVRDLPHRDASVLAGLVAIVLTGIGIVLARAAGDTWGGAVVASAALPYALVAGLYASGRPIHGSDVLIGCLAAAIVGGVALAAIGRAGEPLVAGVAAALAGAVAAVVERVTSSPDAAALLLGAVVLLSGLIPAAAIRLGGVARWHADGGTEALADAVARTEAVATGLLGSIALVGAVTAMVLAYGGNGWSRILAATCAAVIALRSRAYGSVRQRTVALAASIAVALPITVWALLAGAAPVAMTGGVAIAALLALTAGMGHVDSPLFGRAADALEIVGLLAVVPLTCAALDLFTHAAHLA
jgi:type VII secretion integral membrane protein EccD